MKSVLDKEEADKVAIAYTPRKFPQMVTAMAQDFVRLQSENQGANFRIDRIVAQQTGVAELERISIEQQVETLALERVKEIQESAYQEAYQLGLDDGREKAFAEKTAEIDENLSQLGSLMTGISRLKMDLVVHNEGHLVRLLYKMASRVVMDEIAQHPERILQILKQTIESAQAEENITVRVAKADLDFINSVRDRLGKDMDIVKKVKLEESDEVRPGGCVIDTNYGSVDASIEQRLEKIWSAVEEKTPKASGTAGE